MKALHVRGIPDELYEALRTSAQEDGRSISAETIEILKRALADRLVSKATVIKHVAERKARISRDVDVVRLIREDRDR